MQSDQLVLTVDQAQEVQSALSRAGFTTSEVKMLTSKHRLGYVRQALLGGAEITLQTHLIDYNRPPAMPRGYPNVKWETIEHDVLRGSLRFRWNPHWLNLQPASKNWDSGDKSPTGFDILRELGSYKGLNARVLDYLLEHEHLIPPILKKARRGERCDPIRAVFPGTIYLAHSDDEEYDGKQGVRALEWSGSYWSSYGVVWLDHSWTKGELIALALHGQ